MHLPQANFTFKMKIVLSFAQIVSNLAIGLDVSWCALCLTSFCLSLCAQADCVQGLHVMDDARQLGFHSVLWCLVHHQCKLLQDAVVHEHHAVGCRSW